jgi:hypothetical protein
MKSTCFLVVIQMLLFFSANAQTTNTEKAKEILFKTANMMGNGWDTVRSIKLRGYGTRYAVDQSERFEGPYISDQYACTLTLDVRNNRALAECQTTAGYFGPSPLTTYILDDEDIAIKKRDKLFASLPDDELQDQILFQPVYLVRIALNNASLVLQKDTVLQKNLYGSYNSGTIHFLSGYL